MRLDQLVEGDQFRVCGTGQLGTLLMVNACRARVRTGSEVVDWAPSVEVDLISHEVADKFKEAGIY